MKNLKPTHCKPTFFCYALDYKLQENCVYYEKGKNSMCKHSENNQCKSVLALANACTLTLKKIGLK
jgi:hypothetical protein